MQPGWYPDPQQPAHWLRWWDGTGWTEHLHPAEQSTVAPQSALADHATGSTAQPANPEPHKTRRTRTSVWWWAAGAVAVALVASFLIVPGLFGSSDTGAALSRIDELPVVATDETLGLNFTEPILDVADHDARVSMRFETDITAGDDQLGSLTSHKWAVRLFSDPSLKSEITTAARQNGDRVTLTVFEEDEAVWFGSDDAGDRRLQLKRSAETWGLHQDYFLVRYVDAEGAALARPIVTHFNFTSDLSAPAVSAGVDPERPGDLALSWSPVEGAERYAIVYGRSPAAAGGEFDETDFTLGLFYGYLGNTTDTTWEISESFGARAGEYRRNPGIDFPSNDEDSALAFGDDFTPTDLSGDEIGVVAIAADGSTSPLGTVNAAAAVGTLPTKLADAALEAAQASSEASTPNGEIAAPKFVPYVDFTGRIQHSPARLVAASVTGTTLRGTLVSENGFEVPIESDARSITTAELPQAVADFNRAAADLAGNPGELHTVATATVNAGSPQTEAQETGLPLPTAVSHPMVTYLAEHMLAGTLSIDISEWVNEPGAPSPRDAAVEARVQTPLAFVASTQISRGGSVVDVTYNYPEAERTRLQAETYETALAAIEQMDIQGADARSKITAFNDYLSDTVEYDYAAYEKYPSSDGHTAAYDATGALLEGTGVCASYAATMTLFAQVEGIEAVTISGKVIEGGYHAWNKFKVDGEWKAVDATWNDGDTPNHDYLLISDEEFSGHAAREEIPERWIVPAYADAYLAE